MNKVITILSSFVPIGENVIKKIPTGEKKKSLFGGEKDVLKKVTEWEQTGYSDCIVDVEKLHNDIDHAVASLNDEGYEVISMTPISSAKYNYALEHNPSSTIHDDHNGYGGYGYGYSFTKGVIILAKKMHNN